MITPDEVINEMVEVELVGGPDSFRKVRETLTRMGVASKQEDVLSQSAHILHRRGQYYICHFKEMFALDGLRTDLSESDVARRNRIAKMLEEWNLIKVVDKSKLEPMSNPSTVFVIKYTDKEKWSLVQKYTMGTKKTRGYDND